MQQGNMEQNFGQLSLNLYNKINVFFATQQREAAADELLPTTIYVLYNLLQDQVDILQLLNRSDNLERLQTFFSDKSSGATAYSLINFFSALTFIKDLISEPSQNLLPLPNVSNELIYPEILTRFDEDEKKALIDKLRTLLEICDLESKLTIPEVNTDARDTLLQNMQALIPISDLSDLQNITRTLNTFIALPATQKTYNALATPLAKMHPIILKKACDNKQRSLHELLLKRQNEDKFPPELKQLLAEIYQNIACISAPSLEALLQLSKILDAAIEIFRDPLQTANAKTFAELIQELGSPELTTLIQQLLFIQADYNLTRSLEITDLSENDLQKKVLIPAKTLQDTIKTYSQTEQILKELASILEYTFEILGNPSHNLNNDHLTESLRKFAKDHEPAARKVVEELLFWQAAHNLTEQVNEYKKTVRLSENLFLIRIARYAESILTQITTKHTELVKEPEKDYPKLTAILINATKILQDPKGKYKSNASNPFTHELAKLQLNDLELNDTIQRLSFAHTVCLFTEKLTTLKESRKLHLKNQQELLKNLSQYAEAFALINPDLYLGDSLAKLTAIIDSMTVALKQLQTTENNDDVKTINKHLSTKIAELDLLPEDIKTKIDENLAFSKAKDSLMLEIKTPRRRKNNTEKKQEALLEAAAFLLELSNIPSPTLDEYRSQLTYVFNATTEMLQKKLDLDSIKKGLDRLNVYVAKFPQEIQNQARLNQALNSLDSQSQSVEAQKPSVGLNTQAREIFKLIDSAVHQKLFKAEEFLILIKIVNQITRFTHPNNLSNQEKDEYYNNLSKHIEKLALRPELADFVNELKSRLHLHLHLQKIKHELQNSDVLHEKNLKMLSRQITILIQTSNFSSTSIPILTQIIQGLSKELKAPRASISPETVALTRRLVQELKPRMASFSKEIETKLLFIEAVNKVLPIINKNKKIEGILRFAEQCALSAPQEVLENLTIGLEQVAKLYGQLYTTDQEILKQTLDELDTLHFTLATNYLKTLLAIQNEQDNTMTEVLREQITKIIAVIEQEQKTLNESEVTATLTEIIKLLTPNQNQKWRYKKALDKINSLPKTPNDFKEELKNRVLFAQQATLLAYQIQTTETNVDQKQDSNSTRVLCPQARTILALTSKIEPNIDAKTDLPKLTKTLEDTQAVLENPQAKNLKRLNSAANEVQKLPGTGGKSWGKILGGTLLIFSGLATLVVGAAFAIPTFGASMLAAIVIAGSAMSKGSKLVMEGQEEQGLAKTLTEFITQAGNIDSKQQQSREVRTRFKPKPELLAEHKIDSDYFDCFDQAQLKLATHLKQIETDSREHIQKLKVIIDRIFTKMTSDAKDEQGIYQHIGEFKLPKNPNNRSGTRRAVPLPYLTTILESSLALLQEPDQPKKYDDLCIAINAAINATNKRINSGLLHRYFKDDIDDLNGLKTEILINSTHQEGTPAVPLDKNSTESDAAASSEIAEATPSLEISQAQATNTEASQTSEEIIAAVQDQREVTSATVFEKTTEVVRQVTDTSQQIVHKLEKGKDRRPLSAIEEADDTLQIVI